MALPEIIIAIPEVIIIPSKIMVNMIAVIFMPILFIRTSNENYWIYDLSAVGVILR
jgi:hypothetical protein